MVLLGDLDRSGRALLSFMCERDAERRGKLNLLAAALACLARGGESALIRQVDGLDPEQTPRYGPLRRAVCGVSRQRFLCRSGSDWQNRGSVRGAVAGLG